MPQPAAEIQLIPMSEHEARSAVNNIKGNLESAGKLALDLRRREGWRALGYDSWQECAEAEFGGSINRIYKLMAAEEVRSFILDDRTNATNESIPEFTIRPLTSLRDEPELIPQAWEVAKEQSNGKPTQADVRRAIDVVLERNGLAIPKREPLEGQRSFIDDAPAKPRATGYDVIIRWFDESLRMVASINAADTPEQKGWGGFPTVASRFTAHERREIKNYLGMLMEQVQEWLEYLEQQ